jgi:hypothetical protein
MAQGQTVAYGPEEYAGRLGGADGELAPAARFTVVQRQRVRDMSMPALPGRPVRTALRDLMHADRLQRNLTQDQYAELLGGSGSGLSRFRRGEGKLPKVMRRRLLELHPRWARRLQALLLEDALLDGTLGATTSD